MQRLQLFAMLCYAISALCCFSSSNANASTTTSPNTGTTSKTTLRGIGNDIQGGPGGTHLVKGESTSYKPQSNKYRSPKNNNRDRRLKDCLGSPLNRGAHNRGCVECQGKIDTHQCPGTHGSGTSSKNVPSKLPENRGSCTNRQHNSPVLFDKNGGDKISTPKSLSQKDMVISDRERN